MRAYLLGGRPILFPFLSGILRYDCEPCDAPCCKGAALGIGKSRELVTLQSVQPKISLFSAPRFASSSMIAVRSPLEECWFLDEKARCRLHRVAGREAKPAGCRLFPFHRIRSVGEAVCVLPDFLCPLEVADAPSEEGPSSHDEIALEMHRTQIPRAGHAALPSPKDLPWKQAVGLERRIVEAASAHLFDEDYVAYCEEQQKLTQRVLANAPRGGGAEALHETIRRFLGATERPSKRAVHDLVALTGTLRLLVPALPRREVPGLLLALSVLVGVYEGMRGAKRSPRTVVSLLEHHLPFLYVLSHLEDRPVLKDPIQARRVVSQLPAIRAPLLEALEAVIDNRERPVADTLEDILRRQGSTFEAPLSAEAVTMLHALGKVLLRTGVFVPV